MTAAITGTARGRACGKARRRRGMIHHRRGRFVSSDARAITGNHGDNPSERFVRWLGWIATVTGVLMFASYIDQIQINLSGQKGSIIQPFATVVNCGLWTTYGALRRDWPVSFANAPGIVLGALALITAL